MKIHSSSNCQILKEFILFLDLLELNLEACAPYHGALTTASFLSWSQKQPSVSNSLGFIVWEDGWVCPRAFGPTRVRDWILVRPACKARVSQPSRKSTLYHHVRNIRKAWQIIRISHTSHTRWADSKRRCWDCWKFQRFFCKHRSKTGKRNKNKHKQIL